MSTRSRRSEPFDLLAIFDALAGVDYVVVGGVAATLHGAPRLTFDLDIVPNPSTVNVDRLVRALETLGAYVREPGNRRLPVTRQLLTGSVKRAGQLRLRTRSGPLDILWRLHDGSGYREIAARSVVLADQERRIRVVGIEALIEIKQAAGRPRDQQDIAYLKIIRQRGQNQNKRR